LLNVLPPTIFFFGFNIVAITVLRARNRGLEVGPAVVATFLALVEFVRARGKDRVSKAFFG
jgi:hypothetical protein